ncbi:hypothetical protein [Candidatus Spongiihabitans sp.]
MNKPLENKSQADTATDTLARKSRAADVVSGGHLVARVLRHIRWLP